jgi:hypothetical protein
MTPNRPGDSRVRWYAAGLNITNFPPEPISFGWPWARDMLTFYGWLLGGR